MLQLVRTHMEREQEKKRQAKYVSKQVNVYIGDLVSLNVNGNHVIGVVEMIFFSLSVTIVIRKWF